VKVVADTSPIHYLILIDQTDLFAGFFGRVFIPPAVEAELRHPSAPAVVRQTIAERPDWLETVLFSQTLSATTRPIHSPEIGGSIIVSDSGACANQRCTSRRPAPSQPQK